MSSDGSTTTLAAYLRIPCQCACRPASEETGVLVSAHMSYLAHPHLILAQTPSGGLTTQRIDQRTAMVGTSTIPTPMRAHQDLHPGPCPFLSHGRI